MDHPQRHGRCATRRQARPPHSVVWLPPTSIEALNLFCSLRLADPAVVLDTSLGAPGSGQNPTRNNSFTGADSTKARATSRETSGGPAPKRGLQANDGQQHRHRLPQLFLIDGTALSLDALNACCTTCFRRLLGRMVRPRVLREALHGSRAKGRRGGPNVPPGQGGKVGTCRSSRAA